MVALKNILLARGDTFFACIIPDTTCLPHVANGVGVIFIVPQSPPQVFENLHLFQFYTVGHERLADYMRHLKPDGIRKRRRESWRRRASVGGGRVVRTPKTLARTKTMIYPPKRTTMARET